MVAKKFKFDECRECIHQRTAKCVPCGAGEFFEPKDDEPTDTDLFDMLGDYNADE